MGVWAKRNTLSKKKQHLWLENDLSRIEKNIELDARSAVCSCDAGTAAGSAAFNLFCISAVCVSAIKDNEAC